MSIDKGQKTQIIDKLLNTVLSIGPSNPNAVYGFTLVTLIVVIGVQFYTYNQSVDDAIGRQQDNKDHFDLMLQTLEKQHLEIKTELLLIKENIKK